MGHHRAGVVGARGGRSIFGGYRASVYAEGVRRGGSLVSVKAEDSEVARVNDVLNSNRLVDARTCGGNYRESGWSGFDPKAPAYTSDQIAAERTRYRSM